ncbi:hypothetical protein HY440_00715 [Candidatus Microgenomates bacterium]|nr:hypothetical protein [Candidatus Microgenomates bacterium]
MLAEGEMDFRFPALKTHIKTLMDEDDAHNRKYHANGANMCPNGRCHRQDKTKELLDALKDRRVPLGILRQMPFEATAEAELFILNVSSRDQRVAILEGMRREIGEERRQRSCAFTQAQIEVCVKLGLTVPTAVKVLHASWPQAMVNCVHWARESLQAIIDSHGCNPYVANDGLQMILMGHRGVNGMGHQRVRDAMRKIHGLPPVPVDGQMRFFDFLKGALEVVKETDPTVLLNPNREAVA